ncbi:B-cadherin-like isoform X1 [Osmerus eperlanus]|uniref:B-cadherin-like isoform X1 n=1 Tax=Osmerus eperlanus TaxID=29151 RepID=UPI002E0E9D6F
MLQLTSPLCGLTLLVLQHACTVHVSGLFQVAIPAGLVEEPHPLGCHRNQSGEVDTIPDPAQYRQGEFSSALPLLTIRQPLPAQRRKKRAWVMPPINIAENGRGPFPNQMFKIRSSYNDEVKMYYKITGPGADLPPIGRFIIERNTGWLSVTEPLDREQQAQYIIEAQAEARGFGIEENPMEIVINVLDQNDNKPEFTQNPFLGHVPEDAEIGSEFMKVNATDRDQPGQISSDLRYSIRRQDPPTPSDLFFINPITGGILVAASGLDRERQQQFKLVVEAADNAGAGLTSTSQVLITVEDSNDNAPKFTQDTYTGSISENQQGVVVVKIEVRDEDQIHTPCWRSRFRIIQGDSDHLFSISTGHSGDQGILATSKELDYEASAVYTLLVVVENEVVFSRPVSTSTATVTVRVEDRNEAPVFRPSEMVVSVSEDLPLDSDLVLYTASDPDLDMKQTVKYQLERDHAGWLSLNESTGLLVVRSSLDRESPFIIDGTYTVLILAIDNAETPATGTGTLVIEVEDVNDNIPSVDQRHLVFCSSQSQALELPIRDPDGPGFSQPFTAQLLEDSLKHWDIHMNDSKTAILLSARTVLRLGEHEVNLRVSDSAGLYQDISLQAQVCDCTGSDLICLEKSIAVGMSETMWILGGVLALLLLLLLLLLFLRKSGSGEKAVLLQEEESPVRGNIYCYDEEGGGEEDQEYDHRLLRGGFANRPLLITVVPPLSCAPTYRPRPTDQHDIGEFIDDNLRATDGDPTALPYDCLLVFNYEGGGAASEGGSLSSLTSCSSEEEQDYQRLAHWGPRFSRLALMYNGEGLEDQD